MIQTICLLEVRVSRLNPALAAQQICQWAVQNSRSGPGRYVCVAPVSTLVEARRNPSYAAAVNAAAMITPDGMPVVWLARLKGCKDIERTYGPDLMHEVCNQGQKLGLRHFFYGSTDATLEKLQQRLKVAYPGMIIAGSYAPPFKSGFWQEEQDVLKYMNDSRADIFWVGLGSPKQDFWMQGHHELLQVPVMVGAGAAFDFLAGAKPQAPRWMQHSGLEWLFRLACEPRRLWKRYLIGNSLFLFYIVKDYFAGPQSHA